MRSNELEMIQSVMQNLHGPSLIEAVDRAIGPIIIELDPLYFYKLDQMLRRDYVDRQWMYSWLYNPKQLRSTLLGPLSCSRDGRAREVATREMARRGEGDAFLLVRALDSYEPIQERAIAALKKSRDPASAAKNILLLHRISSKEQPPPIVQELYLQCLRSGGLARAENLLLDRRRDVAFEAWRVLSEQPNWEKTYTADVIASEHAHVRLAAARELIRSEEGIRQVYRANHSDVRRMALRPMVNMRAEGLEELLREGIWDRSGPLRVVSQFYAESLLGVSPCSEYKETSGKDLAVKIAGIGETCGKEDSALVVPYLEHEVPKIRREAVRALARLDIEGNASIIGPLIMDASRSVSRSATEYLLTHTHRIPLDEYVATGSEHEHVQRNLLKLLYRRNRWTALPHMLAVSHDEQLQPFVEKALTGWTRDARSRILLPRRETLDTCRAMLSTAGLRRELIDELTRLLKDVDSRVGA